MAYQLAPFASLPLDEALLQHLIDEHESIALPRLLRLWTYYRNNLGEPAWESGGEGGSRGSPQQSRGLPARLRNPRRVDQDDRFQREIVIENNIAWRIHALVDFMFPAPLRIISAAADPTRRREIEAILDAVLGSRSPGGLALWQDASLLGSIYGHVDFLLTIDPSARLSARSRTGSPAAAPAPSGPGAAIGSCPSGGGGSLASKPSLDELAALAGSICRIETIEAPRAIALLNRHDYRVIDAHVLHYLQPVNEVERDGWLARLSRTIAGRATPATRRAFITVTEIRSATHVQRYEDGALVAESINRLGRVPVVHVQNHSQPLQYEGLSDVEPLIPLQDELNTRLSDRANRVTMQSFRMYLGVGIDGFTDRPVGPGQMWMTDNPSAKIETFGGDADSPSERQHIEELREALDKASGVTPAAAGHIKAKIGNLTSENALRISLMGTIAKIKRKRITYGMGIRQLAELILHALDVHGIYRTHPGTAERAIEIAWPDPLPSDETRRIDDALKKAQLGVPLEVLRGELGYAETATRQFDGASSQPI